MNSLPEAPLKLKDQTTMKETMKANLTALLSGDLPPAPANTPRTRLHNATAAALLALRELLTEPGLTLHQRPARHQRLFEVTGELDAAINAMPAERPTE